ncbi:MAG: aminotransferase class I/II-fold pyridoxal phosphate-dependent enzyme [Azospirillum sp.]|nr:aminotransferase class I/II-fold pyridoxal phosphate-dependent enzyme [Azospirillum sp.]
MEIGLVSDLVQEVMELRRDGDVPLHRQIYSALQQAIIQNQLPAGTKLPASRDLARVLGVGRNTVLRGYEQLLTEGYVLGQIGAGTFVADTLPDAQPLGRRRADSAGAAPATAVPISRRGHEIARHADSGDVQHGAFMPGIPDVELFPHDVWRRLIGKYLRRRHAGLLQYSVRGHAPLKASLTHYLHATRCIQAAPDQVLLLNGCHQALDLCARMLTDPGDIVMMEDPGYWGARNVFRAAGLSVHPVSVDAQGMAPSEADWALRPRLIFLTPSSQYPTGVVLSLARRRAILAKAAECGAWIIEDDYDNELRYHRHPLAPLFGLSTSDRVIYLGTFSKAMFPGLRLAYLIVPPCLVEPLSVGSAELYREGRLVEQAALADFIADGHFASHIRRMRMVYAERQAALRTAIEGEIGELVTLSGGQAGIHLVYFFQAAIDDHAIAAAALAEGVIVRPLSLYYQDRAISRSGLVLGYAGVAVDQIAPAAVILTRLIRAAVS